MLDHINRWNTYLSDTDRSNDEDLIELYTHAGRPLGCADFARKLEVITDKELAPKRPGRKPVIRK